MKHGKWWDKIIKANEDSWLRFFNPHQFLRAVITNQKNVSYAIYVPLQSRLYGLADEDSAALTVWAHTDAVVTWRRWISVWMWSVDQYLNDCWITALSLKTKMWMTWGPLGNTDVVSGPVGFSASSAVLSCRFPWGSMLGPLFFSKAFLQQVHIFHFYRVFAYFDGPEAMGHTVHRTRDLHFVCAPIYSMYIFIFFFTSDFSHKCLSVWWQRVKIRSLSLSPTALFILSLSLSLPWLIVIECSERLWFLSIFCILFVIYVFSVISNWGVDRFFFGGGGGVGGGAPQWTVTCYFPGWRVHSVVDGG